MYGESHVHNNKMENVNEDRITVTDCHWFVVCLFPLPCLLVQDAIGRLTFQALGDNPSESLFLNVSIAGHKS